MYIGYWTLNKYYYVCIWCMFVFLPVVVTVGVCGNVCCVVAVVKNSVFFLP